MGRVMGPEPREEGRCCSQTGQEAACSGNLGRAPLGTPTARLCGKWTSPTAGRYEATAALGCSGGPGHAGWAVEEGWLRAGSRSESRGRKGSSPTHLVSADVLTVSVRRHPGWRAPRKQEGPCGARRGLNGPSWCPVQFLRLVCVPTPSGDAHSPQLSGKLLSASGELLKPEAQAPGGLHGLRQTWRNRRWLLLPSPAGPLVPGVSGSSPLGGTEAPGPCFPGAGMPSATPWPGDPN